MGVGNAGKKAKEATRKKQRTIAISRRRESDIRREDSEAVEEEAAKMPLEFREIDVPPSWIIIGDDNTAMRGTTTGDGEECCVRSSVM